MRNLTKYRYGLVKIGVIFITILTLHLPASAATVTYDNENNILIDGEPFFPIMQWLQSTSSIPKNKAIGINTFVGVWQPNAGKIVTYLDAYENAGVWGIVPFDTDNRIKNHPALLSWIFADEPDLQSNKILPSAILAQYNTIKTHDPNHLAFLTITGAFHHVDTNLPSWMNGSDQYYYDYAAATDVIGFDKYPIYGWCREDFFYWVGDAQKLLRETYARNQHPTYQWIELMKCCSKWCYNADRNGLAAYPEEIKAEVWYAIIHGAKAIGYFTHSWRNNDCSQSGSQFYTPFQVTEEQKNTIRVTNGQITALTSVIASPFTTGTTSEIKTGTGRVDFMTKSHNGDLYIFAANVLHISDDNNLTIAFTVPGLAQTSKTVEVYDESRTLTPVEGVFSDTFSETDPVHIYVIRGLVTGEVPAAPQNLSIMNRE